MLLPHYYPGNHVNANVGLFGKKRIKGMVWGHMYYGNTTAFYESKSMILSSDTSS